MKAIDRLRRTILRGFAASILISGLVPTFACQSRNYTLKPDSLQPGDVVIAGRWERFDRKGYQPPVKAEWDWNCTGRIDIPVDRRAYFQLGYYPGDMWAVRLPQPLPAPLSISVECRQIYANTESGYAVFDGRELGLYRNAFASDRLYVMPPRRLEYAVDTIVPQKVDQDDSPAAAKKIYADMLEYWPQFEEREMVVLESSIEEDY